MKKMLIIIIMLLFPFNVYAYSNKIVPGGNTIGIELDSKGIMIIGFYKINNKFNRNDLKVGDVIIKVADKEVNTIDELVDSIDKYAQYQTVNLTVKRNEKVFTKDFKLVNTNNKLKTGLYVKDNITGIGRAGEILESETGLSNRSGG